MNFTAVDVGWEYQVSVVAVSAAGSSEVATITRKIKYHPSPSYPGKRCHKQGFEGSGKENFEPKNCRKSKHWRKILPPRLTYRCGEITSKTLPSKKYSSERNTYEHRSGTQIRKRHFSYSRTLYFFRNWSILRHITPLYYIQMSKESRISHCAGLILSKNSRAVRLKCGEEFHTWNACIA